MHYIGRGKTFLLRTNGCQARMYFCISSPLALTRRAAPRRLPTMLWFDIYDCPSYEQTNADRLRNCLCLHPVGIHVCRNSLPRTNPAPRSPLRIAIPYCISHLHGLPPSAPPLDTLSRREWWQVALLGLVMLIAGSVNMLIGITCGGLRSSHWTPRRMARDALSCHLRLARRLHVVHVPSTER
jgi:hypothetical protein